MLGDPAGCGRDRRLCVAELPCRLPQSRARDRAVLIALRLAALAVVLFCLLRPELILKAAVPQQNFLGVLIDDSRSLQIAGS